MRDQPPASPDAATSPGGSTGAVLVWLGWTLATALPFLVLLWGAEQRGRFFHGVLLFPADMYQYLSFVEQAARGRVVFSNKFDPRPLAPFLVHVEWLGVGWLAALLGGRILLAFHLAGALAGGVLAAAVTRVLRSAGLAGRDLAWGLALVLCGSGLGWLCGLGGARLADVIDAYYLIYPANQRLVGGPHALLGTGLLLLGLVELVRWRSHAVGAWRWLLAAVALGLSRPFDMALLLGAAVLLWCLDLARGVSPNLVLRQAASTAWVLPVLLYDGLAYGLHPSFGLYASVQNTVPRPPAYQWVIALAPAAALALRQLRAGRTAPGLRPLRDALLTAVGMIVLLLTLPLTFGLQFATPVGTLLLVLAATALPRRALPLAALALCPTSLWLFAVLSSVPAQELPGPHSRSALDFLEQRCAPGDLLLAPEAMSIFAAGLTPCRVVAGHWVLTPDYRQRMGELRAFYAPQASTARRAEALARWQPELVLAPAGTIDGIGPYTVAWRHESLAVWQRSHALASPEPVKRQGF